jgi:hypothetical protein
MTPLDALYFLLELAAGLFFVWILATYVAKASPGKEIMYGVAVLVFALVLLHKFGPLLSHGHP